MTTPWLDSLQEFRRRDRQFQRTGVTEQAARGWKPPLVYRAPWAMPAWGWAEFLVTGGSVWGRAARGPQPRQLAEAVRNCLGKRFAFPVGQARVGIEMLLRAAGAEGGEVVMPSYVCSAVLEAVLRAGATPVFADIGEDLHIHAGSIAPVLTSRTRAVIVPHQFGNTAPIDGVEQLLKGSGILLIDDAAQSFGARRRGRMAGAFGGAGVVSVGILKALAGAAGAVIVTDDEELYRRLFSFPLEMAPARAVLKRAAVFWVKRFRRWTWPAYLAWERVSGMRVDQPYELAAMSNLDAAIGLAQLRKLHRNAARRRRNARLMIGWAAALGADSRCDFSDNSMLLQLAVVLPESGPAAFEALRMLAARGVEARMSLLPCHYFYGGARADLPNTESLWRRVLCLPLETRLEKSIDLAAGKLRVEHASDRP